MIPGYMVPDRENFIKQLNRFIQEDFSKNPESLNNLKDFIDFNEYNIQNSMGVAVDRQKLSALALRIKEGFPGNEEAEAISNTISSHLNAYFFNSDIRQNILSFVSDSKYGAKSGGLGAAAKTSKSFKESAENVNKKRINNVLIDLKNYAESADEVVDFIIKRNLTKIDLSEFADLKEVHLEKILAHHNIKSLWLGKQAIQLPKMESLEVLEVGVRNDSIADMLVKQCPNLQELRLCSEENDEDLAKILNGLSNLIKIAYRPSEIKLTGDGFEKIKNVNKNLKELILNYNRIQSDGYHNLVRIFPNIEILYLLGSKVNDDSIVNIAAGLSNLKIISLTNADVTDVGVKELLNRCAELKDLGIWGTKVTGEGLSGVKKHLNLERLILPDTITNKGLIALSVIASSSRFINLSYLKVDGKSLSEFVKACKHLEEIEFSNIKKLDNGVVLAIKDACLDLTALSLENCKEVTDSSILELVKDCKKLTYLNLMGTGVLQLQDLTNVNLNLEVCGNDFVFYKAGKKIRY